MASKKYKTPPAPKVTFTCFGCGGLEDEKNFYRSTSVFYKGTRRMPICKTCLNDMYQAFYEEFKNSNADDPYSLAWNRICMGLNIYYNETIFKQAFEKASIEYPSGELCAGIIKSYMPKINVSGNHGKDYLDTIKEENEANQVSLSSQMEAKSRPITLEMIDFWGQGYPDADYRYLQKEYENWVSRHECNTKAQEEVFKTLCFLQLDRQKARIEGKPTKDLDKTFNDYLSTAKLQPKQNASEAFAKSQTFGTLIDRIETEEPIPEPSDEFKDVDGIRRYVDAFFRGTFAKMMNIKNRFSQEYDEYNEEIKKYTVEPPTYEEDDESEVIFDAIFGGKDSGDGND